MEKKCKETRFYLGIDNDIENGLIKFLNFPWEEKEQVWQQIKNLRKKEREVEEEKFNPKK